MMTFQNFQNTLLVPYCIIGALEIK